jgi:hypothetical protein
VNLGTEGGGPVWIDATQVYGVSSGTGYKAPNDVNSPCVFVRINGVVDPYRVYTVDMDTVLKKLGIEVTGS